MTQIWQNQVRVNLGEAFARVARTNLADPSLKPLTDVLSAHNATIKNQYDAFADFCRDCETNGQTGHHLYNWTKKVVDDPVKQELYVTRFTVYADGNEVYDKAVADAIEADMTSLVATGIVTRVDKFDSNPANTPQPPKQG